MGQDPPSSEAGESGWGYLIFVFAVVLGLGAAFFLFRKSRSGADQPNYNYNSRYADYYRNESYEMDGVDAEKELEWLRKGKKTTSKVSAKREPAPAAAARVASAEKTAANTSLETSAFQEKMRRLQYSQLPINSFSELSRSKPFESLPVSDDPAVLTAIEQANEEFEEDESVRELAVRILTAFRTRNSVEALAQIALYDLSSNLRSKAVTILTDFDHESVFEPIVLACADPTREVRAAAARGLFRLNFDRSDAWKRLIETGDEFRMSHAARAAIESGIAVKSFDRLVHEDLKVAYEAFTLVSLMVRSGETREIFNAIRHHKDERVKIALLHVLKANRAENILAELERIKMDGSCPAEIKEKIKETINSIEHVRV